MHLDELTSQTAACYKFLNHWHYVYYYKDLDKIYCYCAQSHYYPVPTVSQLTATNEDLHAKNEDLYAKNGDFNAINGDSHLTVYSVPESAVFQSYFHVGQPWQPHYKYMKGGQLYQKYPIQCTTCRTLTMSLLDYLFLAISIQLMNSNSNKNRFLTDS